MEENTQEKAQVGDKLISAFELFDINGKVTLAKGQEVTIREIEKTDGHYSRICPDIWVPEKINAFKLVGIYGSFKADTFISAKTP